MSNEGQKMGLDDLYVSLKEMPNGFFKFTCSACGRESSMVMSSDSMQMLSDLSTSVFCPGCKRELIISHRERRRNVN